MRLLHTENVQGNVHEAAKWLNSKGWAEKVVSISSSGFTSVVILLLDSKELLEIRSQPRFDFSRHAKGAMHDFPTLNTPTDIERLVEFCAIQDLAIRDGATDDMEPTHQGWRNLPQHLQAAINARADDIDAIQFARRFCIDPERDRVYVEQVKEDKAQEAKWTEAEMVCVDYFTNYEEPRHDGDDVLLNMWKVGERLSKERV